ncbi:hypothetical protein V3C99_012825 [Haemonchus contortus]
MHHFGNVLVALIFISLLVQNEAYTSTYRLCGLCKVFTELVRFGLSHNVISNFLLLHCSSMISSSICLVGADLLQNILHSLTLIEVCQLEHMCSASASGFGEKHLNLSRLPSYDVDAINIMLSRVDSVENFTDLTIGVGPNVERVVGILADYFPLLRNVRMSEDQYDTIVVLTNRFLMALDYKLGTSTGEGLREHLKPCKHGRRRLK